MVHHLSFVQIKHLSIFANQTFIIFDNVLTGSLPDLVVVGLVSDAHLACCQQINTLNFRNFGVNCIELKRNSTPRQTESSTFNFENGQYRKAYSTFL